jgi:Spy/CpxP family protein refolding chaperone
MIRRALSLATAALLVCAGVSPAQGRKAERAANQAAKQAARAEGRGGRAAGGANQQALAKQIHQAFAGVVRKRLNLTDDQARQLDATQQRFQQQRTQVQRDERQARVGLKAAMEDSTGTPDQAKISSYMDQLVQAQHRRATILEEEQKELSGYLTPLQRAQYQALHEQLNKRIQQMQQQRAAGAGVVPTP